MSEIELQGVEPGCGEAAAQAGIDRRFRALMTQLAQVSRLDGTKRPNATVFGHCMACANGVEGPSHAQRGLRILAELADAAARAVAAAPWVPFGCSDWENLRLVFT